MNAVRWTQPASDDFLNLVEWIAAERPNAAASVGRRILNAIELLRDFPMQGRTGRLPDTRELVVSGLPFGSASMAKTNRLTAEEKGSDVNLGIRLSPAAASG